MAVTPEGKVKTWVKKLLADYQVKHSCELYLNWPVPGGYGESMLDLVGCAFGHFFMIETKAPGKEMSLRQQQCAARVRRAGGRVWEIDSVNDPRMGEVLGWIDRMRLIQQLDDNVVDQEGRVRVRI